MQLRGKRPIVRLFVLVGAATFGAHCSLLAPEKEEIVGERPVDVVPETPCEPAPPCDTPPPTTTTPDVTPDNPGRLVEVLKSATPGQTIFLAAGEYQISDTLLLDKRGLTLASATGNADDVHLIGAGPEILIRVAESNITLSALTMSGASQATVRLGAGQDTTISGTRLCGVHIVDGGAQPVLADSGFGWSDCGLVEGSTIELTDAARDAACAQQFVSGVSVEGGRDWVIRKNEIRGFHCPSADPPLPCGGSIKTVAVLFTLGARDTIIENNWFIDSSRGIAFGFTDTTKPPRTYEDNPYPGEIIDHYDGIIRNNVIFTAIDSCLDTGIELNHARMPEVLHNTIFQVSGMVGLSAIDRRYTSTQALIRNNLVSDEITVRNEAPDVGLEANITNAEATYFVDVLSNPPNLHLVSTATAAIDTGVSSANAGVDMDGQAHGPKPDIGADELSP
ncbi:MAG: hypothetical protein HOV80_05230 [Polyangiaceae bacterium]|nr:hypothetical protein [Polyangiaceae bacterium]